MFFLRLVNVTVVLLIAGTSLGCQFLESAHLRSLGGGLKLGKNQIDPLPALNLEECFEIAKSAKKGLLVFDKDDRDAHVIRFLYCASLLAAEFDADDDLSFQCLAQELTDPVLEKLVVLHDRPSFGYPISDESYVRNNLEHVALNNVLPSFFEYSIGDKKKSQKGEDLLNGLFHEKNYKKTYQKIVSLAQRTNNSSLNERVYVASYESLTDDGSTRIDNPYRRFAILTIKDNCWHLSNLVPNDSTDGLHRSAMTAHSICSNQVLDRVDGRARYGAFFYSWRASKGLNGLSRHEIIPQMDQNCLRCHNGRSTFAHLDVREEQMTIDDASKEFMRIITSKDSYMNKSADFLLTLSEHGKKRHLALPKHWASSGRLSYDVPKNSGYSDFLPVGSTFVDTCTSGLKKADVFNRCQSCHGAEKSKPAGPLFNSRKDLIYDAIENPQHFLHQFHKSVGGVTSGALCIKQILSDQKFHENLSRVSKNHTCEKVKSDKRFSFLFVED